MKVLIVEDELFIRMDLEQRIQRLGAELSGSVAGGAEAVELAKRHRPDLILMDIKLKGEMTGFEAAEAIAAELPCAIAFISAFERSDFEGLLEKARGSIGYYSKPLYDETLRKILAEVGSS